MATVTLSSIVKPVVLAVGVCIAASGLAWADSSGFAPGGYNAGSAQDKPASDTGRAVTMGLSKGWHYRYCDYVWVFPKNGSIVVSIENKDGSSLWYSGDTEKPSIYQEMMIRACSKKGAYYGFRVYDASTGAWNAVAAY